MWTQPEPSSQYICGTMMGHQTFRHRLFYCNYPVVTPHECRHEGKYVGSRGVRFNAKYNEERFGHLPDANMYGIYSRPYSARGTADAWHGALGHQPGTFSEKGLRGALPTGYGRLLSGQAIAHSLHRQFACPVLPPGEREPHDISSLETWACHGFKPLAELNLIQTLSTDESPSILEAAWPDKHKLNALIQSTWPCQSDAVLANDSPSLSDKAVEELHEGTIQPQARTRRRALPDMDAVPLDMEPTTAPATKYDEAVELPTFNPYVITRAEQMADPTIYPILQCLERSEKLASKADPLCGR